MKRSIPDNRPKRMEREKVLEIRRARLAKSRLTHLMQKAQAQFDIIDVSADEIDTDIPETEGNGTDQF